MMQVVSRFDIVKKYRIELLNFYGNIIKLTELKGKKVK